MAIETRCSGCGTILAIDDQHRGALARCPKCNSEYTVPETTDDVALDAVCHFCDTPLTTEENGAPHGEFKTCFACQDSIQENESAIQEEHETAAESRRLFVRTCVAIALLGAALAAAKLLTDLTDWL